jgi:hypothetical protein
MQNHRNNLQKVKIKPTLLLHIHKKQPSKPPPIMITGLQNHKELTSITKQAIGDEYCQTKLMNIGITKVNVRL